jgi:L-methionine (R)-S-oxide reductase
MNSLDNNYQNLLQEVESMISSGKTLEGILSDISNLLKSKVYHYDWVGFYLLDEHQSKLVLGPFCGKPTEHTQIPIGKGVCGQVAESKKLKVVQDTSQENNYIACSIDVQSEIVVPILKEGQFVAEIDIDSHSPSPFTKEDEAFLTDICEKLSVLF